MKALVLILVGCTVLLYGLLVWPALNSPDIIRFLILSQVLLVVYLLILFFSRRLDLFGKDRKFFLILIVAAVLIRIILPIGAAQTTYLSDDVYRYIWEGKLVVNGYNPFTTTPASMASSGMADSTIYPKINHPWLPTIYPPLSQYLFAMAYLLYNDTICGFKIISFIFELFTLLAMLLLFKHEYNTRPIPSWRLLIYLFSPLLLIEFLMSNHLDILAMPFFVLSIYFLRKQQATSTGITLALASMVKLFGLFFVPVLFFHFTGRDRLKFTLAFAVTALIMYAPFLISAGTGIFGSLITYLSDWQYNGSLFQLLKFITDENIARKIVAGLFLLIVLIASIFLRKRIPDPVQRMFVIFGAYIILTPSLFPWYLVWIIPFLVLYFNPAFLVLSGMVFLSYHVLIGYYDDGAWSHYWYLTVAEYLPFFALLGYQIITRPKQRKALHP